MDGSDKADPIHEFWDEVSTNSDDEADSDQGFLGSENTFFTHDSAQKKEMEQYFMDNIYDRCQKEGITHSQSGMIDLEQFKMLFDEFVPYIVNDIYRFNEWSKYTTVEQFVRYINLYIWIALRKALAKWLEKHHKRATKQEKVIEQVINPNHRMGINSIPPGRFSNEIIRRIEDDILFLNTYNDAIYQDKSL